MSTDGYPSGRMFRTDIFSMFRSYYLRGYLFSIKVIPQSVLRFFFWHGSAWHASGCQKGAADGIWLLGWRLATRAKSAPKFRFRIFPIHRSVPKLTLFLIWEDRRSVTQRDLEKYLEIEIFGSKLAWVWNENRLPNFSLKKLGANLHP